jgi:hypothetical protein
VLRGTTHPAQSPGSASVPCADHDFFEEQTRRLTRSTHGPDTEAARDRLHKYLGHLRVWNVSSCPFRE